MHSARNIVWAVGWPKVNVGLMSVLSQRGAVVLKASGPGLAIEAS